MARRQFSPFNLSFLDCISCGFGAVLLLFVIVNAKRGIETPKVPEIPDPEPVEQPPDLTAEVTKLKKLIVDAKKNRIVARNTLEEVIDESARTEGAAELARVKNEQIKVEISDLDRSTMATRQSVEALMTDVKSKEEASKRLEGGNPTTVDDGGSQVRKHLGDGDRQYLTGMKVGGRRILILLDASASMLGDKLVDVLIRRNLPPDRKRAAAKWRQATKTVDWITSQMPQSAKFQIIAFNQEAAAVLPGTDGNWLEVSDVAKLNSAVDKVVLELLPDKGTSFHNAFQKAREYAPAPDNIFLITDGFPTMKTKPGFKKKVTGRDRASFFQSAIKLLPAGVPVNTILLPMEGEPQAPAAFWVLAKDTNGSFFSPSKDWP